MVAGTIHLAGLAQSPAEAEVGVVVDVLALDHGLELDGGLGEAAGAVVGAAQGLADGGLLRGSAGRLGERLGGIGEVAIFEQLDPTPVEGVGLLCGGFRGDRTSVGGGPARLPKSG